ncbi:Holliday junction resolvase RuvX [Patescibacteria group bacterium]|nr:Holliday junction resolvase RuvX [Patescibacteria group bacterium]
MDTNLNYLALDYGLKRIGLASGASGGKMAFARGIIENKGFRFVLSELGKICDKYEIDVIIIGLPLNMDNEDEINEMTKNVRHFGTKLKDELEGVEIKYFDERLSSHEADDLMKDAGNIGHRDEYAAMVILQRYFDCQ